MARKCFILDTNVLLHDSEAIAKFPGADVVLPLAVVEELEAMKKSREDLGKSARIAVQKLDGLRQTGQGDLHAGIRLPGDSTVRVQIYHKQECTKQFDFIPSVPSHRILMVGKTLQEEGHNVTIVSKDFAMRIKAEAAGLVAQDYENLKFSYDKLRQGVRLVDVDKSVIDSFLKNGMAKLEGEFAFGEYVQLSSPQGQALGRFEKGQLVPLVRYKEPIWGIAPLNIEQRCVLDLLLREDIKLVSLVGQAGTGKTLLALACGLRKVFDEGIYTKILVSRPIMPLGKDIGYLPGLKEEKLFHWMQPIYDNLEQLCFSSNAADNDTMRWVIESKKIEMEAVTYIRGRSLPKAYIIIDEAQNLTPHEVKTIISRAAKGTKVILAGDPTQIDNPYLDRDSNGLTYAIAKFKDQKIFGYMCLEKTERSELAALAAEIL